MSNKKNDSPLVKSVLALDNYLSELERVGARINSTDMSSDFDLEYIQKLMTRFAECGQGIAAEIATLSTRLLEAQSRAETVAQGVSSQAELLKSRRAEEEEKLEKFRVLGDKVRELNAAIGQFRRSHGQDFTEEDRAKLAANLSSVQSQLAELIEELQELRKSARDSRMRALERDAESLGQTLQNVRAKLRELSPPEN